MDELSQTASSDKPGRTGKLICCPGFIKTLLLTSSLIAALVLVGVGYLAGRLHSRWSSGVGNLPILKANSAVTSDKFSIATGVVSEDADGLFVLDHNSGLLQCTVIYPRVGRFLGQYRINVNGAIGSNGKGGQYMMITGRADFPRASNRPAASTVVYVIDTATGNYACYGVPFDRVAMNSNRPQSGALILIATGTANPVVDRDSLR